MNLLDPTGPLPEDPAGMASHADVSRAIRHNLPTAGLDQIVALAWRMPGATAQIIQQLMEERAVTLTELATLRERLMLAESHNRYLTRNQKKAA